MIMGTHLVDKIWNLHKVGTLPSGQDQIFIGLHLLHEVTSPQAFAMLAEYNLKVAYPQRTFATVDHIIPTENRSRPFADDLAEAMIEAIEKNTTRHKITCFGPESGLQGVIHIIGPELGLTQPGMTIVCGDSHTATHGAFGSLAFGIGTSQVRDVLATQTMAMAKPKVRKIQITGKLAMGVTAKDIILKIIAGLGVNGGLGYAYEYAGPVVEALPMEARMTICNMSIEGGARFGYINPDQITFDYLNGRKYAPTGTEYDKAVKYWKSVASDANAKYDDVFPLDVNSLAPMVTWGVNPSQAVGIDELIPSVKGLKKEDRESALKALEHMGFAEGEKMAGKKIEVAFIGSCTNGRISDLREAAEIVKGKKKARDVWAFVVPGSNTVKLQAEKEGLDRIFKDAGFQWREAGCSICLGMNPDKLTGAQMSASSSNRNFIGRQGSPRGRTLLMSAGMVAAAALAGEVVDIRKI
ncbi:MAG: 3-isopropylmalate dehydratase large subunit [Spirochaetaceae bacterium]|nr:MAG: 3-isopropylmalate dehydratase large subunit [Spirochaetaceae bacterium]